MIGIKTAWHQVKEEIRAKAHAEGRALGHNEGHAEGRAAAYAELKSKTRSEIAAALGIDDSPGAIGHNTPPPDRKAGRPENAG